MTMKFMNWAYSQDVGAPECKFLLVTLANYADHNGAFDCSIERLISDVGSDPFALGISFARLLYAEVLEAADWASDGRVSGKLAETEKAAE